MKSSILLLVLLLTIPCEAHDHGRPELNDWLASLTSKGGAVCCDGKDAFAVDEWGVEREEYFAVVDGKKHPVPPKAVIEKPNRHGQAIVCFYPDGRVRCFVPGAGI